jgi:hypothetical protein
MSPFIASPEWSKLKLFLSMKIAAVYPPAMDSIGSANKQFVVADRPRQLILLRSTIEIRQEDGAQAGTGTLW